MRLNYAVNLFARTSADRVRPAKPPGEVVSLMSQTLDREVR